MIYYANKISFYSFLSKIIGALCGPLTLLLISKNLSSEEIAFYYTFFNLIALQQLAELGLSFTLKQSIAHAYKVQNGIWELRSKIEVKSYIKFGFCWFAAVAGIIIIIIGPLGYFYYSDYIGNVNWLGAWIGTVLALAISVIIMSMQIFIEATQNQLVIYRAQVIYVLVNSFALWFFLYNGMKLYSIPLSILVSNVILFIVLISPMTAIYKQLKNVREEMSLKKVFSRLWPYFSRVAVVWGVGFLLWNGFNLISFKMFTPELAGKIIFSITLARAGFMIAESIVSSQITVVSNLIATNKSKDAHFFYSKYRFLSIGMLIFGYFCYFIFECFFPDFYIFNKLMPSAFMLSSFVFFLFLLILTTGNNFVRCYKVEPFVFVSIWHSLAIPVVFLITSMYAPYLGLYPCVLILVVSILWSRKLQKISLIKYTNKDE
ncbi:MULTISPECIES: hypothetical protein [Citrobacter]|uniref:hypothetical protein n=1 Tax=Citrobacter TaxID=544 RepID=UPI00079764C7|nr:MULTISPECIES: hypothetical protein [Citrobacter]SAC93435.1 Uncharacterised protein [Enterobacter cloacae]KAA0568392.1 hypothetical protein F0326_07485 [Citrobacter portucalensis]MDM2796628.1 hypothetical protein [Citrobacter sp. Cpo131]MDM2891291.1 hypothetical protein [Citrobacter sp. Cpo060]MDW2648564.1 hypothetical protein [Citrobacter portucalensis]